MYLQYQTTKVRIYRMDDPTTKKPFPLARHTHYSDFRHYYAYGNTPAEDLLRHVQPGVRVPNILLLGCGDLRSCFYTLWKNFGSGVTKRFDGAHFDLNDSSSAIIARDILFLHLCLKMPQDSEAQVKEWIAAFWAIWFCHELHKSHYDTLKHSMQELIALSRSPAVWLSEENPLCKVVKLSSVTSLEGVRQNWITWSDKNVAVKSVKQMHKDRLDMLGRSIPNKSQSARKLLDQLVLPCTRQTTLDIMEYEILQYYNSGSVFVEEATKDMPSTSKSQTFINLTFYERQDGKYSLHYESIPFRCFFQSYQFSPEQIRSSYRESDGAETATTLLVNDSTFDSYPLLSNSVQQFSLWIRSCASILQNVTQSETGCSNISFTFHHCDALEYCLKLQSYSNLSKEVPYYDLIHTSNLIDHLTPTNLVLAAIPLTKQNGFLFTSSMKYNSIAALSPKGYLQLLFGMDLEMIPIILGVSCINYEGIANGYSSEISVKPILPNESITYIWKRVSSLPLKHPSLLENSTSIQTTLCKAFCNASPSLLIEQELPACRQELNAINTETVMHILHSFIERVECDVKDYHFWMPLAHLLLQKSVLTPYLHCIQTHALLHGFHIHLVVDEATCPVCTKVPLNDYICQFQLDMCIEPYLVTPKFLILIHEEPAIPEYIMVKRIILIPELLQIVSNMKKACHAIDSYYIMPTENGTSLMQFYMPTRFLTQDYKITVFSIVVNAPPGASQFNLSSVVTTKALSSVTRINSNHAFKNAKTKVALPVDNSFGSLKHHTYDKDMFQTTIKLSDECASSLKTAPLSPKRQSSSTIEISAGSHKFALVYPAPVDYSQMKIKIYKSSKMITIEAQRKGYDFHTENLLFFVNPSDELSVIPASIESRVIDYYCFHQFSQSDLHSQQGDIFKLQLIIFTLFQHQSENFFVVNINEEISAFIIIEKRLLDLELKCPCIHIAYSSLSSVLRKEVLQILKDLSSGNIRTLEVSQSERQTMEQIFHKFSQQTIISQLSPTGVLHQLHKRNILDLFSQAVVYPLYHSSQSTRESTLHVSQCHFCGACKPNLRKCRGCGKAKYCGEKCQKRGWKSHRTECKSAQSEAQLKTEKSPSPSSVASEQTLDPAGQYYREIHKCCGCGKEQQSLRHCPCQKVAYCSQACQRMDWERHKSNCNKKLVSAGRFTKNKKHDMCCGCEREQQLLRYCPCHKVAYCSQVCQRMDWERHRANCTKKS